jgi:hypothetical protein
MWLSERLRAAGFGRRIRLGIAALSMTLLAACQVAPV